MTGIGMAGLAWLGHERVGDSHTSVCADELVTTLREMMAGQMASQAAMLGAMKSGFAAKEEAAETQLQLADYLRRRGHGRLHRGGNQRRLAGM